jgi:asparagine synthase (glutamine-hydrolysing)
MCGIAGIIGAGDWLSTVEAMTETLRHRGPDDGGSWSVPGVALGHRRLAIVDLSPAGHQPMHFGDYTIVYNGEIYNFRELRRELDGPFHSDSDTEVILHLYARYGPACLERLAGMFAFAIWDERKRELFVARDRLGIKPFFYLQRQGLFAFASELKALAGLSSRRVDHTALWDYFSYKYIPGPKTIYEDVRQLPPAHAMILGREGMRTWRYWSPEPNSEETNPDRAQRRLEELLHEVVPAHMIADVPIGVFLSGGIDSTAVVASLDRPKTFAIGFDDPKIDEAPYARRVAAHLGTEHHERQVPSLETEEALTRLPAMFDEPFADLAAWSNYVVSREARRFVTVALSGEGGDEVFSGYLHHAKSLRYRPSVAARALSRSLPPFSKLGISALRRASTGVEQHAALTGPFNPLQKRQLLADGLVPPDYDDLWHLRAWWRPDLDRIKAMQWLELNTFLPDDLLVKVDRSSMAVSLEVRPPFLDHRIVEFGLGLASSVLRDGERGKLPLRRYLAGKVPDEVLTRRKQGFGMGGGRWLQEHPELTQQVVSRLARRGILGSARMRSFHGTQLWVLHTLDRWLEAAQPTL